MVELNLHGGRGIVEEAVEFFIKNGARLAQNGEFTKRAFLNGRLDLSAAEGVLNLINSQTSKQAAHAFKLHDGVLKGQIDDLKEKLLEIIAALSAAVDYPEEDIEQETIGQTKNQIEQIFGILQRLEDSYKNGKLIKDGVSIAIIGDVNVGKSQLINALTRSEAAIVSDIAGTTRDIVKDFYNYQGYKFVVFDCAGIRKTSQKIERIGIERAKKAAMEADIVLVVFERECGVFSGEIEEIVEKRKDNIIFVQNKVDLDKSFRKRALEIDCGGGKGKDGQDYFCQNLESFDQNNASNPIKISALKDINVEFLKEQILKKSQVDNFGDQDVILTESRHYELVLGAKIAIKNSLDLLFCSTIDLILSDLNTAFFNLCQITGASATDDIIDSIFSKFCVGK